jgi:transposase
MSDSAAPLHFIGVDIAKDSFVAARSKADTKLFPNSADGASALIAWARHRRLAGECRFVCESTGPYSRFFAFNLLANPGASCAIVPPQRVRYAAKAFGLYSKTDKIDAKTILAFAELTTPQPYALPEPEVMQLEGLRQAIEGLKARSRELANEQHALSFTPCLPECASQVYAQIQQSLRQGIAQLNAEIEQIFLRHAALAAQRALLLSIPGIGPIASADLLCIGNVLRQRTPKELAQYAGLAPAHRESGSSIRGKSMITHAGNRALRKLLYMLAVSASRYNPHLKTFYTRLVAAGKPKKLALIAVARKLLLLARAILISGRPYDPLYGKAVA